MPDHVEAESVEAKRFLKGLRDILGVPKFELDDRVKRHRRKQKSGRAQTNKKNPGSPKH